MEVHRGPRATAATTVTLALTVVLLAPVTRVLFPRLYLLGEDASFLVVGLLGLLVFGAPILALVFVRLPPRALAMVGVVLLAVARLAVQFLHPVPVWLAVGSTASGLVGATCVIVGLSAVRTTRASLPLAVVAGLALDTAMRLPTGSWEPVWQEGPGPIVLALALVTAAVTAAVMATRGPADHRPGVAGTGIAAIGPFLMLQFIFLQNLGGVGASVPVTFPATTVIVLTGDVLALGVAWFTLVNAERLGPAAVSVMAALVVVASGILPAATGAAAIWFALPLQGVASGCLALGAVRPRAASPGRGVVSVALAALGFLGLALAWQLHIDRPLPFPRTVVPALAGLWLGLTAVMASRHAVRPANARPAAAAAAVLVIGTVVAGVISTLSWPAMLPPRPGDVDVTVVSFNVRGALGEDAMIDANAIADSIAASDPDVVLLQEVARGWPVFGQYDLLGRLSQRLRLPYRYEPAADVQFGNAILSRLPVSEVAAGPLPEVEGSQDRSFIAVRVETIAGPLLVVDTHLESDSAEQIDALLAAVGGESPAVIGGDLNMATTDTANVRRFTAAQLVDAEAATGDPCRTTSVAPTSTCDRPDWVWVTPDLRISRFAIGPPSASDHLPVEVTVAMPSG
jgi:endonuclease/exonuclease/phosphatase family metal-dependent hydrolase